MSRWQKIKLEDALNYIQPTKYIVESTDYDDSYKTPVLTPGKSFLLGYTDENYGIYDNVPTIIFDDFTTAFKYVDFPFKVKSSAIKILALKTEGYDVRFLYYLMLTLKFEANQHKRYWISKYSQQTVNVPSLAEQKRIVKILDAADRLRQKDKQLIEHYTALSQSLFLDMFGDPVANTLNLEVKKLGELTSKISSGNTPKGGSAVYVENGILFLRSQNVWRNKLELDDVAYLPSELHEKMQKTSLLNGDILMTKTGRFNTENSSLGRAAMYRGEDNQANLNGHVYLIRVKDDFSKEFILHILTTPQYRDYIRRVCVGGIDKRQLNKTHLEDFPIICPAKELQLKFVAALNKIEVQKQKAEQSLMKSEELFNCLLQRAFKGELTSDKAA